MNDLRDDDPGDLEQSSCLYTGVIVFVCYVDGNFNSWHLTV